MRKSLAISSVAALLLAGPAMAADFSYNTLELGLTGESIDDPGGDEGLDGSGLSVSGSWALNPGVFGFASLSGTDYEYRHLVGEDFTAGRFELGLGFNIPLSSQLDLVSGVSVQRLRLEDQDQNALNEDGYGLKVGLRGMASDRFEWTAGLNYVDFGHGLDDTSWTAGFRYHFTRRFSMGLDIGSSDKDQGNGMIGFRWDFGRGR